MSRLLQKGRVSYVDLVELDMFDFAVVFGMYFLYVCISSIDCITRVVKFNFPNDPVLEWKVGNSFPKCHVISFLKACKVIFKGCSYHIVGVQDLDSEISPIESVTIVKEFL